MTSKLDHKRATVAGAADALLATSTAGRVHQDYELHQVLGRIDGHIAGLSADLHLLHDLLRRRRSD